MSGLLVGNPLVAADADWHQGAHCPPPASHHSDCDPCEPNPHVYQPGRAPAQHHHVPIPAPHAHGLQPLQPSFSAPHQNLGSGMQPRSTSRGQFQPTPEQPFPSSGTPGAAPFNDGSSMPPMGSNANQFDSPVTPNDQGQPQTQPQAQPPGQAPSQTPSSTPDSNFAQNAATPDTGGAGDNNAGASNNFDNINASDLQSSFASTQSSFSSAPSVIGDFAGGGFSQFSARIEERFQVYALGSGGPSPTFDIAPGGGFNPDVDSIGSGMDLDGSNDGFADTYSISEPLPPTDAPTSPGPGFQFQGGTAVYTNNSTDTTAQAGDPLPGQLWYLDYTYAQDLGGGSGVGGAVGGPRPVPSPGVAVRRVKISENFSAEIRNRSFLSYSFFNDSFGGLGDVSRYIMGIEQILVKDLLSIEARLPVAATYASHQNLNAAEDRDMEIGNFTVLGKIALLRGKSFLWSGGVGVGTPTADDTRLQFRGAELVNIRNKTFQIQPFSGLLFRWKDWVMQSYLQLDVAAGGDPVFVNTNLSNPENGQLQQVGTFTDSTLMHLDVSLHRKIYERKQAKWLNTVIANAELHYTSTLQDADIVQGGNFTYTSLQPNFDIVNATTGFHLMLGREKRIIVTPAVSVPLRTGLNEQFDYEGIVQVNFLR